MIGDFSKSQVSSKDELAQKVKLAMVGAEAVGEGVGEGEKKTKSADIFTWGEEKSVYYVPAEHIWKTKFEERNATAAPKNFDKFIDKFLEVFTAGR